MFEIIFQIFDRITNFSMHQSLHHINLPITVASRKGELPSVRGEMPEITFQYLTPEKFNELKAENFGNVPLDDAMALFLKECASIL